MLGYVDADRPELKVRELAVYNSYYCGLCKRLGLQYGQIMRKGLSYDLTFLALLLASLTEKPDRMRTEHCIVHWVKRQSVLYDEPALEYAADMTVILGYENYLDDQSDPGSHTFPLSTVLLGGAYRRARDAHREAAEQIHRSLAELYQSEQEQAGIDRMAELFGRTMQYVMLGFLPDQEDSRLSRVLAAFAEALGRWIYVMDAYDDREEDAESGSFNPFLQLSTSPERQREIGTAMLYDCLEKLAQAYELLPIQKNRELLDNIIYFGLRKKTESVLGEGESI